MASSRPLDIVARFRTVTTDFNTRAVEKELDDGDRAFDQSSRKAKEWQRDLSRSADKVGDDLRRTDLDDAGSEVGQEFAQNIGEGIGSGSIDIQDAILGTLGGLVNVPILGPAALIGGTIVASIVGGIQANNEKMRQAGISLLDAFQDGILESSESEQALIAAFGVESFKEVSDEIAKQAKALKVPKEDLLAYYKSFGDVVTPALEAAFGKVDNAAQAGARGVGTSISGEYRRIVGDARTFVGNLQRETSKVKGAIATNVTADDIIKEAALRDADARTTAYIGAWEQRWKDLTGEVKNYNDEVARIKVPTFGSANRPDRRREP